MRDSIVNNQIDSKEKTAQANVCCLFGGLLRTIIKNNNDAEVIFAQAGLSEYFNEYKVNLCPFIINGKYQNDNADYNPEYVCLQIGIELQSRPEGLVALFNCILGKIKKIENSDWEKLSNCLSVIGYELKIKDNDDFYGNNSYKLAPLTSGEINRSKDIDYLSGKLLDFDKKLCHFYDEAISNFGHAEYKSCIDNCRTLFEKYFKTFDKDNGEYVKGILAVTKEEIIDNGKSLNSIKSIYQYWIDKKKGANRFRLFQTTYSVLSGLGTHSEENPTKEDALLLLRVVEDILLWCFRKSV